MLAIGIETSYIPQSMTPEMLRAEMDALGIKRQIDIAEALGVSQPTVSLWFSGESRIPPMVRLAILAIKPRRTVQATPRTRNGRGRKVKTPKP